MSPEEQAAARKSSAERMEAYKKAEREQYAQYLKNNPAPKLSEKRTVTVTDPNIPGITIITPDSPRWKKAAHTDAIGVNGFIVENNTALHIRGIGVTYEFAGDDKWDFVIDGINGFADIGPGEQVHVGPWFIHPAHGQELRLGARATDPQKASLAFLLMSDGTLYAGERWGKILSARHKVWGELASKSAEEIETLRACMEDEKCREKKRPTVATPEEWNEIYEFLREYQGESHINGATNAALLNIRNSHRNSVEVRQVRPFFDGETNQSI
jgi:hypothetical protein